MFLFTKIFLKDFFDLLFPVLCLGCKQVLTANEKILCTGCRINLPETGQHRQLHNQDNCNKLLGRVPIQSSLSYLYFNKGGIVQKLIHSIKYKGRKEDAKEIAIWYGHQLKEETKVAEEIDLLIGVPLHASRMKQRGYNQADWIAEGLSEVLKISMRTDVLVRNKFKGSQTSKGRLSRWENVETVFSVINTEAITNKNVVVVDDVLTTGATIEACANALLRAGCKSVSVLTLAVAAG